MLKTIVAYLYQLRAIVRSERAFADRRERITDGSASVPRAKTLHGNVNSFTRRYNLHRMFSAAAARTLYLAPLSRDKTFSCLHTYHAVLVFFHVVSRLFILSRGEGNLFFRTLYLAPIVTPPRFHRPRTCFLLA